MKKALAFAFTAVAALGFAAGRYTANQTSQDNLATGVELTQLDIIKSYSNEASEMVLFSARNKGVVKLQPSVSLGDALSKTQEHARKQGENAWGIAYDKKRGEVGRMNCTLGHPTSASAYDEKAVECKVYKPMP